MTRVHKEDDMTLWLVWRCTVCEWETTVAAPGFGGDGHYHYPDGATPCGPLVACRATARDIETNPATETALLAMQDAREYLAIAEEQLRRGVESPEDADRVRCRADDARLALGRASDAMLSLVVSGPVAA